MKNSLLSLTVVKDNWHEQKGKLKTRFSTLADANLHYKRRKSNVVLDIEKDHPLKTKEELTAIDFSTLSTF